jgi:hypothetical protein
LIAVLLIGTVLLGGREKYIQQHRNFIWMIVSSPAASERPSLIRYHSLPYVLFNLSDQYVILFIPLFHCSLDKTQKTAYFNFIAFA